MPAVVASRTCCGPYPALVTQSVQAADTKGQARWLACRQRGALAWCRAQPTDELRLTNREAQLTIALWLGLRVLQAPLWCSCGGGHEIGLDALDALGACLGDKTRRYNALRDTLADMMHRDHWQVCIEQRVLPNTLLPAPQTSSIRIGPRQANQRPLMFQLHTAASQV